jgi:hypothetical protein
MCIEAMFNVVKARKRASAENIKEILSEFGVLEAVEGTC